MPPPHAHHRPPRAGVHPVTLDGDDITLSALLSRPAHRTPRATVVCLHGGGMGAAYFHGRAHPDLSLLTLGAQLGYSVLAVDRPGYGGSAAQLPAGQDLVEQTATLRAALGDFTRTHAIGAGLFLLAHSYGGKPALALAGDHMPGPLLGLDISGLGSRYSEAAPRHIRAPGRGGHRLNWGPLSLYPSGTFVKSRHVVAPVPEREAAQWQTWPERYQRLAARLRVPIRFTFAEHEAWWQCDGPAIAQLTAPLRVPARVDHLPRAGHNISLGWSARSYHLAALAFLEQCLTTSGP